MITSCSNLVLSERFLSGYIFKIIEHVIKNDYKQYSIYFNLEQVTINNRNAAKLGQNIKISLLLLYCFIRYLKLKAGWLRQSYLKYERQRIF